ncbi:glycogen synthase GlgA [Methylophaga sp.]|uniref:glycogen synthase GlgA n=1 Tax=Methylophaga sp. TaxID=2024840 RepID=UPI0013FEF8B6|nr:glycogen synthase GlgA [Methylophaga sp.]MTI63141.1 glycogen synthase GlgA [Methylophaga sp.]
MRKILFASSEVHPLMKTGGLADVSASLPIALREHGQDVRIIMPAYRQCLKQLEQMEKVASVKLDGYHLPVDILQTMLPDSDVILWLLHSPFHFDREGGPYSDPDGGDWHDNAARFALLSRAAAAIAMNEAGLNWQPDILHCNDWQTGLAPALLAGRENRPETVFTIHNLAYQGLFPAEVFQALDLPDTLWQMEGLEFHGLMSFMKGGLIFADQITTVSPTYADEICTYEFGYGLEGLLAYRRQQGRLSGILNGIDYHIWNPETDPFISKHYSLSKIRNKAVNKAALQQQSFLPDNKDSLLIGIISRLVSQKGIDLAIEAMARVLEAGHDVQLVCLGSGESRFERDLRVLRAKYPDRVAVTIGYDEALSHQIEAGADVFMMPSRFEPCGLNQMYSLRYGTLPIVRNTGGLADTVVDASEENRKAGIANGFCFDEATVKALEQALLRAVALFARPRIWRSMMLVAMQHDFSWENSANAYIDLYHHIVNR